MLCFPMLCHATLCYAFWGIELLNWIIDCTAIHYSVFPMSYTMHYTHYPNANTIKCTVCTMHHTPFTTPYAIYHTRYALHTTPIHYILYCTLYAKHYTLWYTPEAYTYHLIITTYHLHPFIRIMICQLRS